MNAMVPHGLEDKNEVLINMASAAVSDKETIASQTRIVDRLTETISTLTAQLSGKNRAIETGKFTKWVKGKHVLDIRSYCWSHGYCIDPAHNSGTCTKRKKIIKRRKHAITHWEDVHTGSPRICEAEGSIVII